MTFTVGRDSSTYHNRFAKCFCFPPKYRRGRRSRSRPQSVIPVVVLVLVFIAKGRYFVHDDVFCCFSSPFLSTQKSTAMIKNFPGFFWIQLRSSHSNQQQKRWRCFSNNIAWMIRWKVCRKDWHFMWKKRHVVLPGTPEHPGTPQKNRNTD